MSLELRAEPVPIRIDDTGVARIGNTRVTLETVIITFWQGASPEEIAHRYPSLKLAEVYAVISYYLHNRDEVDRYVEQAERESEAVRREYESRFDPTGIRERLLARRQPQE